jgi:hypothetical protein
MPGLGWRPNDDEVAALTSAELVERRSDCDHGRDGKAARLNEQEALNIGVGCSLAVRRRNAFRRSRLSRSAAIETAGVEREKLR